MSSSRIIYNRKRRSDDESSSSDNSDEDIPPLKKIRDWNTWDTDGNLTFGKIRKVIDWVFQRHSERDGMSRHHCLNQVPIPIEDEEEENIDVVEISSDNDDPIIEEDGDSDEPRRDNLRNPSVYVTTRGITLNSLSRQPVNGCNNIYPMRNKKNSSDHQKMKAVKYVGPITNPSPDVEILFDTREAPEEESDDVEILSEICSTLPSSKSLARPSISSAVSKYALTSSECNGASSGNIANGNTPSYERERSSNKSFTAHEVRPVVWFSLVSILFCLDKSRLVKKESLVEPVNEFLQKYYKPYHAAYKRCASPKAGLPEFTADDDDVQIIETDSSDSDQYNKKTITLETEQHLQTIALQEEKLERYKKIIINFYLALIRERCRNHPEYPQVHYFNTYFFAALKNRGPRGVLRWTRRLEDKKNIFEFDIVFVPLHLGMHWALCGVLKELLSSLKRKKLDITMDPNEYSIEMVKEHMQYFRRRMIFEILDKKLF
ncbi:Sentrin-specific protease like protein [Argiope bruennichi]|uniref:Sentrin-specific protease like protein n=1 Tax=Argiope bruennichi TaxID=94029 RepID=A0A8T0EC78_ARGBR|nr:Sentrin-specific protease like protein [Argiope bruennichi]